MTDHVLHLGAHKTGSSLIQNTLRRTGDVLAPAGVRFSSVQDAAWEALGLSALCRESRAGTEPDGLVEAVAAFIEETGSGDPAVHIVSAEGLLGRPLPQVGTPFSGPALYATAPLSARVLRKAVPGDTRVVLYLRGQAGFVESVYRQRVLRIELPPFGEWLSEVPLDQLSWRPVVEALADEFGPDSVVVKWFRLPEIGPDRHVAEFLADACGVEADLGETDLSAHASNPSLSDLGVEIARRTIPLLRRDPVWDPYRRFLLTTFSALTHPRTPLMDAATQREITDRYDAENEVLLGEFGTDLERTRGIS